MRFFKPYPKSLRHVYSNLMPILALQPVPALGFYSSSIRTPTHTFRCFHSVQDMQISNQHVHKSESAAWASVRIRTCRRTDNVKVECGELHRFGIGPAVKSTGHSSGVFRCILSLLCEHVSAAATLTQTTNTKVFGRNKTQTARSKADHHAVSTQPSAGPGRQRHR